MTDPTSPSPPAAEKRPVPLTHHGHTRHDPYYWMRERQDPAVIAYLESENEYTAAMLADTEPLQEQLYEEMVGRIQETDTSAPVRLDDYYYYTRTEAGKQYDIYCRKHGALDAEEEILLDLNRLAEGHDYLSLGVFSVSPDHRFLAFSLDTSGAEKFVLTIKDLESGERLPEEIQNTAYSAEWGNDNQTLFYTTRDDAQRTDKVWRHRLGTPVAADELLFHETDERFWVDLDKTKDRRLLLIQTASKETSESHYLDADQPQGRFSVIAPRRKDVRYSVDHHSGTLYIVTNLEARNNRLMTAPVASPGIDQWRELIAHDEDVKITAVDLFADHLVVYQREHGLRTIRVSAVDATQPHYVSFPEPVYTYSDGPNLEFHTHLLRFTYESLTTPDSVYDYNMESGEWTLIKREPVLGGYDPDEYRTERLFATAGDGTKVPISLVYRRGTEADRPQPCLLYGYGSYGYSVDPSFSATRISLLDRGFVFAIAHIRGGQEMGRFWYDEGKLLNKRNTFTDFIACARHLIDQGYTIPEKLAIFGGSAGGLLIGAVLNMAPELFGAAVATVPFVDVVTTMLDETIPLTIVEYEEWGNPNEEVYYQYMLSYSPYDNVEERAYPHLLVTAGLNDPRVQYWEPAKWTARLRERKTDDSLLLLKTEMGAGHAGPSGRYDYLREVALRYAFVLEALSVGRV